MKVSKGFTLIELLVVIAIIGILSSVVLASLTTARSKGQNAAIQQQLSSMRSQAELYYSTNSNSYGTSASCAAGGIFGTANNGLGNLITGASSSGATAITCASNATTWMVVATLPDATKWCVDYAGNSAATTTATAVVNAVCK